MRSLFTVRLASAVVVLALNAIPGATQVPKADSSAEFELAATWTPARTSTVAPLRRAIALHLEGASVKQALREIGWLSGIHIAYGDDVLHSDARVSLHADGMTVREALGAVLQGTGLDAFVSLSGKAVLVRAIAIGDSTQVGTVTGRVTDAKTGQPIAGVSVVLVGTRWHATTSDDGRYRLEDVTVGTYALTASRIGYAKQSQSVSVTAGQELTVDVALGPAATELEQVVVTGSVTPTERKAIPTPISVISADEIEQKGYQRVDQIFRGDVPGAIAWDLGPLGYFSTIAVRGASTLGGTPTIKTFIDGVEVADPMWIATIDPNMIERIEITRGPQASTLYGAGALNGVMQIFTKEGQPGVTRPQVMGKVSAGGVDGLDGRSTAAQTDNTLSILGGGEGTSYNLGGSYRHVGDWAPSYNTTDWNLGGGARMTQGLVELSGFARYAGKKFDYPWDPRFQSYTFFSKPYYQTYNFRQQTYGLTARVQATGSWQHSITLGYDQTYYNADQTQPRYTTPSDSFLTFSASHEAKTSVLYHSDLHLALGRATAVVTGGVNYDAFDYVYSSTFGATRTSGSLNGSTSLYRTPWTNTGYFAQLQVGLAERLFLTAGLRAERNANFGEDFGTAWSPKVGAAYVFGLGSATVKIRASWGEGIRAPDPGARQAITTQYSVQLANPALAPERQRGGDGGVEVYVGRASLAVSYYNQRAIDLISQIVTSSGPPLTYQFQNISRVNNDGWEFEGRLAFARLQLRGTYSLTNSTVGALPPSYPSGGYQVGDRILGIPHTSAGATITYSPLRQTTLTAGLTYIGHWVENDWVALYAYYNGVQPYRGSQRAYWIEYPVVTKLTVAVNQTLRQGLAAFVRAENVGNNLRYEAQNLIMPTPRSVVVGLEMRH